MMNFIYFMHYEKKTVFMEWLLLNQAVIEVLGRNCGGLRWITVDQDSDIYKALI